MLARSLSQMMPSSQDTCLVGRYCTWHNQVPGPKGGSHVSYKTEQQVFRGAATPYQHRIHSHCLLFLLPQQEEVIDLSHS